MHLVGVRVELPTLNKPGSLGGQVVAPGATRMKMTVRPRRPRAGRRAKLIFYVTVSPAGHRVAVRGAKVRFAGLTRKTNKRGRATMRVKIRHAGLKRATVTQPGLRKGTLKVRVLRRR